MLSAMQYKDFVWPHNPKTYSITYTHRVVQHKLPFGSYTLEDLGGCAREMEGEGEFYGPDAYDTFRRLACVFASANPGVLIHPLWQSTKVYFTQLRLLQEPREDYVAYAFHFVEALP